MTAHTPGPWKVDPSYDGSELRIIGGEDERVVARIDIEDEESREAQEDRANAQVMAGAPTLLEACWCLRDEISARLDQDDTDGEECERLLSWRVLLTTAIESADPDAQRCRVCGCAYLNPCDEGCYWVEEDLCSSCAEPDVTPGATR